MKHAYWLTQSALLLQNVARDTSMCLANLYNIKLIATVSAIDSTASDVLEVEMV